MEMIRVHVMDGELVMVNIRSNQAGKRVPRIKKKRKENRKKNNINFVCSNWFVERQKENKSNIEYSDIHTRQQVKSTNKHTHTHPRTHQDRSD